METIGYAKRAFERVVVYEIKDNGGKQERVENMEAKNLPNGTTLTMSWNTDTVFSAFSEII